MTRVLIAGMAANKMGGGANDRPRRPARAPEPERAGLRRRVAALIRPGRRAAGVTTAASERRAPEVVADVAVAAKAPR